ncbi:Lrp/AsnC family transcriptional regulator [Desulfocurvus vexinensis]|uniref:Lrp/AsnC family transcriptional regulator n=1 Tax=Desulfocurvus vexinensis TaxID=399548 RepID=UPI00055304CA|nr:Lrp/AsnC family transcriptional regulator [Desulfocurvus vexinensis]
MAKNETIDETDRQILDVLQANARTSNAEIARRVGKAPSAVLERIRKLEARGAIQGYETRVNPKALGHGLTAFTFVHAEDAVGSVRSGRELAALPEVLEVHHTAGQDAYLIKVRVQDTEALGRLLRRIGRIQSVRDTRTTIVLTTVKETLAQALDPDDGADQDD